MNPDEELAAMKSIAKDVGAVALALYNGPAVEKHKKADGSTVGAADNAANETGLPLILNIFGIPREQVLSEELLHGETANPFDAQRYHNDYWTFDAVDGSDGFYGKTDEWCTMLSHVVDHAPVTALVFQPATDQFWSAARGKGTYLGCDAGNIARLHVVHRQISDAILIMSKKDVGGGKAAKWRGIFPVKDIVTPYSIGIRIGGMVMGSYDGYLLESPRGSLWDIAPCDLILSEAEGKTTTRLGNPIDYDPRKTSDRPPATQYKLDEGLLCATPCIHKQLLEHYLGALNR